MLALLLALGLAMYPAAYDGNVVRDRVPAVTAYLRSLPTDTLVAGVPTEADSVPALAHRPVLTNREYALAYHTAFADAVRQRTLDLIDAYYAESPGPCGRVRRPLRRPGLPGEPPGVRARDGRRRLGGEFEPYTSLVLSKLHRNGRYALLDTAPRCGVLTDGDVTIVPASCFSARR